MKKHILRGEVHPRFIHLPAGKGGFGSALRLEYHDLMSLFEFLDNGEAEMQKVILEVFSP